MKILHSAVVALLVPYGAYAQTVTPEDGVLVTLHALGFTQVAAVTDTAHICSSACQCVSVTIDTILRTNIIPPEKVMEARIAAYAQLTCNLGS